jgi:hypothetical protein
MSMTSRLLAKLAALAACASLGACATTVPPKDFTALKSEAPHSILVVPALNNTADVRAPDFFVSTISRPFAERGYYVFPAHMVKRMLEEDGLSDAGLVHSVDSRRLGKVFGCDSVLYVVIQRWDSRYVVLSTQTTVKFDYVLKSCKTNTVLWNSTQEMVYSPQANNSSGNLLAGLIAQAIVAAIEKGAPNFMPLTTQANAMAAGDPNSGLPAGPYLATK